MDFSTFNVPVETSCHDQKQIIVNRLFVEMLNTSNCLSFAALFSFAGGEVVKEKDGLEIRKVSFAHDRRVFFIKKHWQQSRDTALKSEGEVEFDEYITFRDQSLATPVPVAFGVKHDGGMVTSFLVTQDFAPLVDLEYIVLNEPEFFRGEQNRQKRQNVLMAIGKYAKKMHNAGCNQKDFNATHILLGDIESKTPKVALFDLQRVDRNPWQRLRWPVKALGELLFTLPDDQFDAKDQLFLFKSYVGRENLSFYDRLLYRWILAKRDRVARHAQKRNLAPKMKGIFEKS